MNTPADIVHRNPGSIMFARYAEELIREGKTEEALEVLNRGLQEYPGYAPGYAVLAEVNDACGQFDAAVEHLEQALLLDPQSPRDLIALGGRLMDRDPGRATSLIAQARRYDPEIEILEPDTAVPETGASDESLTTDVESDLETVEPDISGEIPSESAPAPEQPAIEETGTTVSEEDVFAALMGEPLDETEAALDDVSFMLAETDSEPPREETGASEDGPSSEPDDELTAPGEPAAEEEPSPEPPEEKDVGGIEGLMADIGDVFPEHEPEQFDDVALENLLGDLGTIPDEEEPSPFGGDDTTGETESTEPVDAVADEDKDAGDMDDDLSKLYGWSDRDVPSGDAGAEMEPEPEEEREHTDDADFGLDDLPGYNDLLLDAEDLKLETTDGDEEETVMEIDEDRPFETAEIDRAAEEDDEPVLSAEERRELLAFDLEEEEPVDIDAEQPGDEDVPVPDESLEGLSPEEIKALSTLEQLPDAEDGDLAGEMNEGIDYSDLLAGYGGELDEESEDRSDSAPGASESAGSETTGPEPSGHIGMGMVSGASAMDAEQPDMPLDGTTDQDGEPAAPNEPESAVQVVVDITPASEDWFDLPLDQDTAQEVEEASLDDLISGYVSVLNGAVDEGVPDAGNSVAAVAPLAEDTAPVVPDTPPEPINPPDKDEDEVTATMAEIFVRQGLLDRAIVIYRKLAAQSPENDRYPARLSELKAQQNLESGSV